MLFDLATARLVERQVLLPGVTILARLVARIRERANARLYRKLARMPSAEQRDRLKELLTVSAGARRSALDRLRRGPTQPTAAGLLEALRRLREVRALGVSELDLSGIPAGRLRVLARYASSARAQVFQRMPAERGIATLLAFACALQATAQDDVLDVLDVLLTDLLARVESQEKRRRLRTIGDLDAAALLLRNVGLVVLDSAKPEHSLRSEIFKLFTPEQVEHAVATVGELARPPENKQAPEALLSRYSSVRQFVPLLLETITPHAADGGRAVLAAWEFLRRIEHMTTPPMHEAPLRIVTPAWRRLVVRADKSVDRRAYTFCVLQALVAAFKRRDLYVVPGQRWGDPRAQLLTGLAWQAQRTSVCRTLGLDELPAPELARLTQELDAAYRRTADNLPTNEAVHIERAHGRHELVLSGLDRFDEPPSLLGLRTLVAQRLPRVELPELLLEVQAWTGFASDFTHVNEHGARADDLPISVCAVLLAEACNVGLEPLVRPEMPALTRARLAWIQQSYIRADTITVATNHLVDVHAALPLTKALGGGELASADGIRFVVPVRSVHAGANPKYFGRGKGVTYINYTSAGSIGFFGFVVPGTLRDSLVILDGLIEQHTALRPTTLVTDSASYTVIWTKSGENGRCALEVYLDQGRLESIDSTGLGWQERYGSSAPSADDGSRTGAPRSASSCSIRCAIERCRSISRSHPWFAASAIKSNSRRRRFRRRGAYSLVVTNLAHVRYRSHSHGPSCGTRRQWPSSSSVLKKFVLSQSTASVESPPARRVSAYGPAIFAPGPSTAW